MRRSLSTGLLWGLAAAVSLTPARPAHGQVADSVLLQAFRARNIGPANPGGRVVDIEAVENDFRIVYVAAASGGVWKSTNAGNTWTPIFED